ncbi:predicted phospholipase [Moesziomyces antarcticus T-34]|uniref:Predicted phospholipase n=1 Tax=Pseudozyma antarctica (strain T-34) TaxID=1151754 RepID=M9M2B2_PSEA3|nr:predicted phospholipase [Moesziomyces antarcticus T-34]
MVRIPALPLRLDGYEGWQPDSPHPSIAKVRDTISADDMWTHFISQRRPVVIDGLLKDPDWKAAKWTDLDYLKSAAGHAPVKIEPIHPAAGHFGTSVKRKKVKFASFLEMLQDPSDQGKWYLTTQYVDETEQPNNAAQSAASASSDQAADDPDCDDSDNEPELDPVLPSPTDALSNDFPARPALLGNLVLQQCNLWLGNSKEGKSSGLHHDFHDNLYILLSGYKRFLLFPPSAHRYLHPRGLVDRVHPNGLIVYAPPGQLPSYIPGRRRPQLPIRPDGLVPSDAARWRRNARLRIKRDIDERAAADAGEGSRSRSQRKGKAKQTRAQELAEEALLQAEAELRICQMDEDGIDPEADTSDDAYDEDDDSEDQADLDGLLGIFADPNHTQAGQSSEEDDESATDAEDSDEDHQVQIRRLLDSLPDAMKPIAMASLAGDQAAYHKLHDYLARIATPADSPSDSPQEPDSSDPESDDQHDDASSDQDSAHQPSALRVPSNGVNKRKQASPSDDEASSNHQDSDASGDIPKDARAITAKRVKISQRVDSIDAEQAQSDSNQSEDKDNDDRDPSLSGEATSDDDDDDDDDENDNDNDDDGDDEDDDEEPAFFAGAESSSEFGDVDEGEAELERLLALAEGGDPESDEDSTAEDDDDEPQSFSRIPPHELHRVLNVPDDPSNPAITKNGAPKAGLKNGAQPERFTILPGCPPPIEVFLKPGQMLYLPASWYHEVTSSSSPPAHERVAATNSTAEQSKVHMALNYWFHPPDALKFEPVEPRLAQGRASDEAVVPGLGVALGESALENRGSGTGTHERPYRDAEVWDEVARAVEQQVKAARDRAR